jgi:hypothetical protein
MVVKIIRAPIAAHVLRPQLDRAISVNVRALTQALIA